MGIIQYAKHISQYGMGIIWVLYGMVWGAMSLCRLRHFSVTASGGVINRGDSMRPIRSISNCSMASTHSSASVRINSSMCGSGASTPRSALCSKVGTPVPSQTFRVLMLGAPGVGKAAMITQFMTSEYMCAYDDSPGGEEGSSEQSVSILLDGEESELVFVKLSSASQAMKVRGHADGWIVVYSISDKDSFKTAATMLGHVWSLGHVSQRSVILVGNKNDLERQRHVSTAEGRTLAKTYECKFIEVSASFDHHVDELLVGILKQIRLKQTAHTADETKENNDSSDSSSITGGTTRQRSFRMNHKSSVRIKKLVNRILSRDKKSKSCENLHIL
ncbi:unnamed protein product, partial [Meganyctiphanes norvegica]